MDAGHAAAKIASLERVVVCKKGRGMSRTKAILEVLSRGKDEKVAATILRVLGAASIEEAIATYEALGNAERKSVEEVVERMAENAGAAFSLKVDNQMR